MALNSNATIIAPPSSRHHHCAAIITPPSSQSRIIDHSVGVVLSNAIKSIQRWVVPFSLSSLFTLGQGSVLSPFSVSVSFLSSFLFFSLFLSLFFLLLGPSSCDKKEGEEYTNTRVKEQVKDEEYMG